MTRLLLSLALLPLLASGALAMTIHSAAPGHLFVAGQPCRFTVTDAVGAVRYQAVDYFGRTRARGEAAQGALSLGALPPGWYELRCQDDAGTVAASLGVVIDRGQAPLPREGRVCGDAASAWLVRDDALLRPFARMVRLAGLPWVRERLSWSATEPAPGKLDWGRYQLVADTLAAQGVHIYQIWHDAPGWSRGDDPRSLCPRDLRDVYRYARAAAAQFARQVEAWEVWNEPDIGFWPDLSDRYVGLFEAAALGLRDGNPRALVLPGSLCAGVSPFARAFWQSNVGPYFDVFNWHLYASPVAYPPMLAAHRQLLRRLQLDDRPAWLTEAGIRLMGSEGADKRLLSAADQHSQCRFVPPSVVLSLAAGNEKHFFFVLPDYLENGVQFGALRPDLTPYPSFLALSAAANLVGVSEYLGEYPAAPAQAHLFGTPRGTVLVAWADQEVTLTIPTDQPQVALADIFGAQRALPASSGAVKVKVGPEAIYLVGVGEKVKQALRPAQFLAPWAGRRRPSRVVVSGHADLPTDKRANCYLLATAGEPFPYTVEVYNFHEQEAAAGTLELQLPAGWKVDRVPGPVQVAPMGRKTVTFQLTPARSHYRQRPVVVHPHFPGEEAGLAVSYFQFDPAALVPVRRQGLDWLGAERWRPEAAPGGTVTVTAEPGSLRFEARFSGPGDRWAYPVLTLDPPVDMSGYDGIAFDLEAEADDPASQVRLLLVEPGGAHYLAGTPVRAGKRRVVLPFDDFKHLDFLGADPNETLDRDRIGRLKLGCNTPQDRLAFRVGGFELVKFQD